MKYYFDKERGIIDEDNIQVLQIIKSNSTEKFRIYAGKLLAKQLSKESTITKE
jgi:hypothetical protein